MNSLKLYDIHSDKGSIFRSGKVRRRYNTAKPKFGTAKGKFVDAWAAQKSWTLDHRCFARAVIKRFANFGGAGGCKRFTRWQCIAGTVSGIEAASNWRT